MYRKFIVLACYCSIILYSSCIVENHLCSSDIEDYPTLSYEIIEKKVIDTINGNAVYEGFVLIKDNRAFNLKAVNINVDSVICFCLNVSYQESFARCNFITNINGKEIIEELEIEYFSFDQLLAKQILPSERIQIDTTYFGALNIKNLDNSWKKKISSENFNNGFITIKAADDKDDRNFPLKFRRLILDK